MTYKTVVSVAESEHEMVPRIRAAHLLPSLIDETARLLIRANRVARVASNRGMPPEQVLYEVLRRAQVLSEGLPADWRRWVDGELYRAQSEWRYRDAQTVAVIQANLKRLMVRPVGVDDDDTASAPADPDEPEAAAAAAS